MTENQHTEYKLLWRDEYLRWVCAFANADGGKLVIGKNDLGQVIGLANAARLLEEIPNKVRDILGILVDVNLHTSGDLSYLDILVDPYPYPISYKGEYHYRSGSTKQELKGAALDTFLLRKQGRRWDGVPVPGLTVADLDPAAVQRFRQRAARSQRVSAELLQEDNAGLVDKLHLIDGGRLKRAAVLLFHPEPERFVSGAAIKIGRFRTNGELQYHDEVRGPLLLQIDRAMDLLLSKYLSAKVTFEGLQRVERYPVPESALREALLNAVAHKDYSGAAPVQIRVYDDSILLWNNGELHPGWTVATLAAAHPSQPYNPDIANAFFRAGLIEAWGSGIARMGDACRAADCPPPTVRAEAGGIWLEFGWVDAEGPADTGLLDQPRPELRLESETAGLESRLESEAAGLESEQTGLESQFALSLVRLLALRPMGKTELAGALGHAMVSGALHRHVGRLKNAGLIEPTLPDKPNSRLQQYRLTAAGRELIAGAGSHKGQA